MAILFYMHRSPYMTIRMWILATALLVTALLGSAVLLLPPDLSTRDSRVAAVAVAPMLAPPTPDPHIEATSQDDGAEDAAPEPEPRMASPFEIIRYNTMYGFADREKKEDERWVIRNAVKAETTAETVYQLTVTPFNGLFSPALVYMHYNPPYESSLWVWEMLKDPRVKKLSDMARHGTAEERKELFGLLQESAVPLINSLDGSGYFGMDKFNARDSMISAVPMLLAEASTPRESFLAVSEIAHAYLGNLEDENSDYRESHAYRNLTFSMSGMLPLAHAMERSVMRLADSPVGDSLSSPLLSRYQKVREHAQAYVERYIDSVDREEFNSHGGYNLGDLKYEELTWNQWVKVTRAIGCSTTAHLTEDERSAFADMNDGSFAIDTALDIAALLSDSDN